MNKTIVKILLLACLVCFVLPFVTVSCGNKTVTANGIELATGVYTDEYLKDNDISNKQINVFVSIAFICSFIAVCAVFRKTVNSALVTTMSVIAGISMILFMATFNQYHGFGEKDLSMLDIEFQYGAWIVLVLHAISAISVNMISHEGVPRSNLETDSTKQSVSEQVMPSCEPLMTDGRTEAEKRLDEWLLQGYITEEEYHKKMGELSNERK